MHDILKTAVEAGAEAMDEPLRNGGIVSTQAAVEIALRAALPGILEAVVGVAEQTATNIRGMADYMTGIPPIAAAVDSLAAAQRSLAAEILGAAPPEEPASATVWTAAVDISANAAAPSFDSIMVDGYERKINLADGRIEGSMADALAQALKHVVVDEAFVSSSGNPVVDALMTAIWHATGDISIEQSCALASRLYDDLFTDRDDALEDHGLFLTAELPAAAQRALVAEILENE